MIRVENENAVHGAGQNRIYLVLLARNGKTHVQEVGGVIEIVFRINEWLADVIFISHRRNGRHFGDHAMRGDHALMRIGNIG